MGFLAIQLALLYFIEVYFLHVRGHVRGGDVRVFGFEYDLRFVLQLQLLLLPQVNHPH